MSNDVTRNNHYVPVWYQRGFLAPGRSQLHYLDTGPEEQTRPDGRKWSPSARRLIAPKGAFLERDLYTTHIGAELNDEVEKRLFGSIDDRGARAVRAYIEGGARQMHEHFQEFFAYIDAQKLRTPKGLDWIRSRYPTLDQTDLMWEMQGLRLMHCRMWVEGIREIVSAHQSDIKFIVTDHPVTIYNPAFPPESTVCQYPSDPLIELVGSQTVFALDANTCLILTHVEYAKDHDAMDPARRRTNAQYRGQSLVRTDTFIRTRTLTGSEVAAINHLLKARARRYIAAGDIEALYPERMGNSAWTTIGEILRPRDELWRFGGETYVRHNDGSVQYQDAYGRKSRSHEYLAKPRPNADPAPHEPCGCGNGRPFGECCVHLADADRPSWDVLGIRERNLAFCSAIEDILGLSNGKTWEDVRRELSDAHVVEIHKALAELWPADTDLEALLPRPQRGRCRALYYGIPDFRMLEVTITGWLAYVDEIVVVHPFTNPASVRPEFNPVASPAQYREQTLKNVLLFLQLEPYIGFGLIHVIPDPGDLNAEFGRYAMRLAQERGHGLEADEESIRRFDSMLADDTLRFIRRLPDASLKHHIQQNVEGLTDEVAERVAARMKVELEEDPLALLQPPEAGNDGAQTRVIKGYGLEATLYLATLTGSVVYTDLAINWRQLHEHTSAARTTMDTAWNPVVDALRAIEFRVGVHVRTALRPRLSNAFATMRSAIRHLSDAAGTSAEIDPREPLGSELYAAVASMDRDWQPLSADAWVGANLVLSVPAKGFERQDIHRLLLTFGKARTVVPVPMAFLVRHTAPRNFSESG